MAKFSVASSIEFRSAEHCAARVTRIAGYAAGQGVAFTHIVTCEASDGSWCCFDAEDLEHAKRLATNAVDNLGCRGASVWCFNPATGKMARNTDFTYYA